MNSPGTFGKPCIWFIAPRGTKNRHEFFKPNSNRCQSHGFTSRKVLDLKHHAESLAACLSWCTASSSSNGIPLQCHARDVVCWFSEHISDPLQIFFSSFRFHSSSLEIFALEMSGLLPLNHFFFSYIRFVTTVQLCSQPPRHPIYI